MSEIEDEKKWYAKGEQMPTVRSAAIYLLTLLKGLHSAMN